MDHEYQHSEFFGCTPERLFSVKGPSGWVKSEALAGTRPRGSTQQEDDLLLHELLESPKDRRENRLTGMYIEQAFNELHDAGLITQWNENVTANHWRGQRRRSNDSVSSTRQHRDTLSDDYCICNIYVNDIRPRSL